MVLVRLLTLLVFSFSIPCWPAVSHAEPPISPAYASQEAAALRQSAESRRKFAEKMKGQAEEYRELEANARRYAASSKDPKDREMWEKDARNRASKARQLEDDAAAELRKAQEEAAQALALEKGISEEEEGRSAGDAVPAPKEPQVTAERQIAEPDRRCNFDSAGELLGLWYYEGREGDGCFAIVQEDPGMPTYANRLELHSRGRVWKGIFISDPGLPKDRPRLTFKYKPEAKEINPEVPEWARARIAGELEWELEVRAECDDGAVMPYAMFYPGEVVWEEGGGVVRIAGRGKARRLNFVPENNLLIEAGADSAIGVRIDPGRDPFIYPVEALIKHQRFHIVVRLPFDLAKEAGETITVELEGLTGGESDTVELQAGAFHGENPVNYTHPEPVTIADRTDMNEAPRNPPFLSLDWIFSNTGNRLDLDVENGEVIQIRFQDLTFEVPVYNTFYQRGNVRFVQGAERLRAIYNSVLLGPYTRDQKEAAHKRIRMLQNYQMLIDSDKLTDIHRYRLGELYMGSLSGTGLVHLTDAQIAAAYTDPRDPIYRASNRTDDALNPVLQAYLEGLSGKDLSSQSHRAADDIVWTSETEKQKVLEALRSTSRSLRNELVEQTFKNLSFGMYQGLVATTGTEDVYLLMTGRDAFGRRVPDWQRLQAAIGLGSSVVLKLSAPRALQSFSARRHGDRIGLPKSAKATYRSIGRGSTTAVNRLADPDSPGTLKPAQKEHTYLHSREVPPERNVEPPCCASRPRGLPGSGAARKLSTEEALAELDADPSFHPNAAYLQSSYPDSLRVVEDFGGSFRKQSSLPTCQAKTVEWIIKKRTGFEVGERELHRMITHLVDEELRANPNRTFFGRGYGIQKGYENWMIRRLGRMFGMKVSEVPSGSNGRVSLRAIRAYLERGASVKAVLNLRGGGMHAYHAVSIEAMEVNSRGFVTRVRFFDPNVSAVLELPARDFKDMLLDRDIGYGNVTVFQ
ncbi:MAG: hypothetical protein AB1512_12130 [Thermodesulfobacteriota bacterium]